LFSYISIRYNNGVIVNGLKGKEMVQEAKATDPPVQEKAPTNELMTLNLSRFVAA
jgi:hypothetical protein